MKKKKKREKLKWKKKRLCAAEQRDVDASTRCIDCLLR